MKRLNTKTPYQYVVFALVLIFGSHPSYRPKIFDRSWKTLTSIILGFDRSNEQCCWPHEGDVVVSRVCMCVQADDDRPRPNGAGRHAAQLWSNQLARPAKE